MKNISRKKYYLSASIVCSDFSNLQKELKLLEKGEVDYIHFDVMDGVFVPRYGLPPEILHTIKKLTKIPVDVHLMVCNPEPYIAKFAEAGADIITVHMENNPHIHRVLQLIKDYGIKAGVALNPATPITTLEYLLDDIDLVMLMAINPGILGHKLIPVMLRKIEDLKKYLEDRQNVIIEIDGGVSFDSAKTMVLNGANMLVCGTSTIFKQKHPLDVMLNKLRNTIG